jgi:ABC-type antimicrobial peptide transport system permease subunit
MVEDRRETLFYGGIAAALGLGLGLGIALALS